MRGWEGEVEGMGGVVEENGEEVEGMGGLT